MAAGIVNTLPLPSVAVVPRLEPYVVEVVIPFPLGSADQAIAAAAEKVAELLAQPALGAATATTPDADEDSPRVATAAMVQAVARLVIEQAREIAEAAVLDVLTTPRKLRSILPSEEPADRSTPWLNDRVFVISPDA